MKRILVLSIVLLLVVSGCRQHTMEQALNPGDLQVTLKEFFQRTDQSIPLISAHRGGPYPGYPENCIETFNYVLGQSPMLIECDVERAGDGTLVLMHDETLDRTTTGQGKVSAYSWSELEKLRLVDNHGRSTSYKIPTFRETLRWAKGRVILTVDIKRSVSFEEVIKIVEEENAEENVVMITYTIGAAQKMHRLNSELMLSVTVRNDHEFKRLKQSGIPLDQVVAFTGTSEPSESHYKDLHREGIYCILGTLGNLDKRADARGDQIYIDFVRRGADIIATDRPLEAADVLAEEYDLSAPYRQELVTPL